MLAMRGLAALVLAASAPAGGFTLQDPAIDEASALVVVGGGHGSDRLWATTNDSGDTGRVFVVDDAGRTVGVTHWSQSPRDVEALAPAPSGREVWVGDIGDNTASREHVQVARVPVGRGERTVRPTIYSLTYPDGAHDAETLLCDPATGRLYVATKGWLGGTLYAAPQRLVAGQDNPLLPIAAVLPMATDGAFLPGGDAVIVRGYFTATTYRWPSMDKIASFPLPRQDQGEGVGAAADGTVWLSSEGVHSEVVPVRLPAGALPSAAHRPAGPGSDQPQGDSMDTGTTGESGGAWWPWVLGGGAAAVALGGFLRSLRRP
ncbi:MAG: hypothetical protein ACXVWX_13880 [Nocardioides sp.]